jgi:hypothetical protein
MEAGTVANAQRRFPDRHGRLATQLLPHAVMAAEALLRALPSQQPGTHHRPGRDAALAADLQIYRKTFDALSARAVFPHRLQRPL